MTLIRKKNIEKHTTNIAADISNWHSAIDDNIAGSDASEQRRGTGGFYAFGVDGMFKGVAIILFAFIGFDSMVMSSVQPSFLSLFCRRQSSAASSSGGAGESNIANYIGAVSSAVLSINGMMFLCLLGMAFVLTTIQPYYSLVGFSFGSVQTHYRKFIRLNYSYVKPKSTEKNILCSSF